MKINEIKIQKKSTYYLLLLIILNILFFLLFENKLFSIKKNILNPKILSIIIH